MKGTKTNIAVRQPGRVLKELYNGFFYIISLLVLILAPHTTHAANPPFMVKDINAGAEASLPAQLTDMSGTLLFSAADSVHGRELWKSDGTASGTVLIKDINPGVADSLPAFFVEINGAYLFTANDGTHGTELWRTDGTSSGTALVKDIFPGSFGSQPVYVNLTKVNSLVFFQAQGGGIG
jgi:ELWxxDGT repeat protein